MKYNIQYHEIDGTDGGKLAEGFGTIEEAREYASTHIDLSEFESATVQIHEEDGETYGEAVEDLN